MWASFLRSVLLSEKDKNELPWLQLKIIPYDCQFELSVCISLCFSQLLDFTPASEIIYEKDSSGALTITIMDMTTPPPQKKNNNNNSNNNSNINDKSTHNNNHGEWNNTKQRKLKCSPLTVANSTKKLTLGCSWAAFYHSDLLHLLVFLSLCKVDDR